MPWTFYKADGQAKGTPGVSWTFYKADGTTLAAAATVTTATVATTVTVTDNESTDENNVLTFVAGADADGGNVGLESAGHSISRMAVH